VSEGPQLTVYTRGQFSIGVREPMSDEQIERMLSFCHSRSEVRRGGVVGPQGIERHTLMGIGRVVLKHYVRGGLARFILGRRYLKSKQFRSEIEFLMLEKVRALGVSAPRPIAFIVEGRWWYRTWLIMDELEGVVALADLATARDIQACQEPIEALTTQVQRMIEHHIFHIDLHPGNVVVDSSGQVYILDFDKAIVSPGSMNALRDRYVQRWRRSVIKHRLPEFFSEFFCARLRKRFDVCHSL
jgi:tRNA A-37 threonylcarbamoyl transferase component Bud32